MSVRCGMSDPLLEILAPTIVIRYPTVVRISKGRPKIRFIYTKVSYRKPFCHSMALIDAHRAYEAAVGP